MLLNIILAGAVLLSSLTIAKAEPRPRLLLPPVEYDFPYKGKLYVEVLSSFQLKWKCGFFAKACAFGGVQTGADYCIIVLPPIDGRSVNREGFLGLKRHEEGHCNGWHASHPGMRVQ